MSTTKDATDFFSLIDAANFPYTGCVLKQTGCGASYSGSKFTIGVSTPWTINIDKNFPAGYSESVCVECSTSANTVTFAWTYNLVKTISVNGGASASLTEGYDAGTLTSAKLATDFFVLGDAANFPHAGCVLKQTGCGASYSGSKFTIDATTPWSITIDRNFPAGYSESACVECSTSVATETFAWTYNLVNTL